MNFTTVLLEDEITIEIPVGIDNCVESLERFQPNFIKEKIVGISFEKFKSDCQFQIDYINQNEWSIYDGDIFELALNYKQSIEEAIKQHINKYRQIAYDKLKYYIDVCFHIMSASYMGFEEEILKFYYPQFLCIMIHLYSDYVGFTLDQISAFHDLERRFNKLLSEKEYLFDKGVSLLKSKSMLESIEYFSDYLRYIPLESTVYDNIGLCYMELHYYDWAISYFEKALLVNPGLPEAYQNLAYAYRQIGNEEKCIEYQHKFLLLKGNE